MSEQLSPRFEPTDYALIDFGQGRKLESFGDFLLDRPSPPADSARRANPAAWSADRLEYQRVGSTAGDWKSRRQFPPMWGVRVGPIRLRIKPTQFGHVGFFPEHLRHWGWLQAIQQGSHRPLRILHLFAYTGATTLFLATTGAEVTHVDAARNVVNWARQNGSDSGLEKAAIRWINDDARKFVRRELKRGARYDGVILDPPNYGHGAQGQVWRIEKHLPPLLKGLRELVAGPQGFWLLTCHSPGFDATRLRHCLTHEAELSPEGELESGPMTLTTADGRALPSGYFARWTNLPLG